MNYAAAKWSNGEIQIKAPARKGDLAGFVSLHNFPPDLLEDGTKCETYLLTHPEWAPRGRIEGSYGPFKISKNLKVQCRVGFLAGTQTTKGVAFRVYFKSKHGDPLLLEGRNVTYDRKMLDFEVPLDQVANKRGCVVLVVQDFGDTDADWPVWVVAKAVD